MESPLGNTDCQARTGNKLITSGLKIAQPASMLEGPEASNDKEMTYF
jgi:hypothetical protein